MTKSAWVAFSVNQFALEFAELFEPGRHTRQSGLSRAAEATSPAFPEDYAVGTSPCSIAMSRPAKAVAREVRLSPSGPRFGHAVVTGRIEENGEEKDAAKEQMGLKDVEPRIAKEIGKRQIV